VDGLEDGISLECAAIEKPIGADELH
jgi:hypothetical protein